MQESESIYDIRQKLLELQNELLKNASNQQHTPTPSSPAKSSSMENQGDILTLLREIHSSQQKIMHMLETLINKLK